MSSASEMNEALVEFSRRMRQAASETENALLRTLGRLGENASNAGSLEAAPIEAAATEVDTDLSEKSVLVMGEATGKPGEIVRIDVLCATHLPINGIGLSVGLAKDLQLVEFGVTDELKEMIGITDPQIVQKRHIGSSWKDTYLQSLVMFYRTVFSQEQIEGAEPPPATTPKRTMVSARIPTLMPSLFLRVKIPDSPMVDQYKLDPSLQYGNRLGYHDGRTKWINMPTEFTTDAKVQRTAVRPDFVSGWIRVDRD